MDLLIGHGRHFGCTIHAFCHIHSLLLAGLQWMDSDEEEDHTAEFVQTSPLFRFEPSPSSYPVGIINREQREQRVF